MYRADEIGAILEELRENQHCDSPFNFFTMNEPMYSEPQTGM
jgi:hypothetical protein